MSTAPIASPGRRLPWSPADVVAACLVALGLVLGATADMAWLGLFALGAFGPSLLREAGLLADRDELQREAARRAGHHAYLAGGAFLAIVTMVLSRGHANLDHDAFPASLPLAVMVVVYLMSTLMSFWGAPQASFRILLAFGAFWLGFVVLSHRGMELAMESLVTLPFFVLAFASRRWPRAAGVVLLACTAGAAVLFRLDRVLTGNAGALMVAIVFALPLLSCGVALLAERRAADA